MSETQEMLIDISIQNIIRYIMEDKFERNARCSSHLSPCSHTPVQSHSAKNTTCLEHFSQTGFVKGVNGHNNVDWLDAMSLFYTSETMEKLCDIDTGLYRESAAYVYDLYKNEAENGRIMQNEIQDQNTICRFSANGVLIIDQIMFFH